MEGRGREKRRKRSGSHRRAKAAGAIGRAAVVQPLNEELLCEVPCPRGQELLKLLALVVPRLDRDNVEEHKEAP